METWNYLQEMMEFLINGIEFISEVILIVQLIFIIIMINSFIIP